MSPCGPIVPVSCPPCPASITMRLIFKPSARVKERCPSRVGFDSVGGVGAAVLVLPLSICEQVVSRQQPRHLAEAFAAGAGLFVRAQPKLSRPLLGRGFASVLSDSAFGILRGRGGRRSGRRRRAGNLRLPLAEATGFA